MNPKNSLKEFYGAVLTIYIGNIDTLQGETLNKNELWKHFQIRKTVSLELCKKYRGLLFNTSFPFIQVIFGGSSNQPNDFIRPVAHTAVNTAADIHREDSGPYPSGAISFGISAGRIMVGSLRTGKKHENAALGFPVSLSRKLALERHRYNYAILLDDTAGKSMADFIPVGPIGRYRIPGPEEIHTLYGYCPPDFPDTTPAQSSGPVNLDGEPIRSYKINEVF